MAEKKAGNDTDPGLTSGAGSSKQPSAVPSEENSLQEAPSKEPNSSSEPATSGPNYAFIDPTAEDTMIVQIILATRMGVRELESDTEDEEEKEKKQEPSDKAEAAKEAEKKTEKAEKKAEEGEKKEEAASEKKEDAEEKMEVDKKDET